MDVQATQKTSAPIDQSVAKSRIVDALAEEALKDQQTRMAYEDYCDWHDTCNSND